MLEVAWWTAGATIALAVLAVGTVLIAVAAYKSQNRQLRALEKQAGEQHAVNIRQIEVLDLQVAELREAPKVRERQAEAQRLAAEHEAEVRRNAEQRQADVEERQEAERRRNHLRQAEAEERQAAEQRRAQAERVFVAEERLDHDPALTQAQRASGVASASVIIAKVRNDSDKPVYDLAITWHRGSAPWGQFERRKSLMPGEEWPSTRALPEDLPVHVDPAVYGAVVWFRDSAGIQWRRRPDGGLDLIPPGQPLP